MKTYTLRIRPDAEGRLHINLPADLPGTEHEVVIVVQALAPGDDSIPPDGTGARMAYEARKANIRVGEDVDASETDDILNETFADYLLG